MSGKNNYKKYDMDSTSGSAPSTKTVSGSFGRKKGGLAEALKRKKKQKAMMEEMDK